MSLTKENKVNLTDFIKGKRVKIISDFEGKISSSLYNQEIFLIANSKRDETFRFIYCGDIADYTGNLNVDDNERYKFLKFIKFINDNRDNFAYVLGNRDLNKLRVLQLVVFDDQTNKWWRGDPSKPFNILEISDSLLSPDKPEWWVEDLTSFYSYWNTNNVDINQWTGWQSAKRKLSLYERFLAIFGVDPKEGTMSAQNTIVCIALELGLLKEEIKIYQVGKKHKDFFEAANRLAALVFTVYARILDPELSGANKKWDYDGSLYEYLINGNIVSYAFDETNESDSTKLYLFSHGGVHSKFNKDLMSNIQKMNNFWKAVDEQKDLFISQQTQTGGQIDDVVENLDFFNMTINASLKSCFEEFKNGYDQRTLTNNIKFTNSTASGFGPFYNSDLQKVSNRKNIEKGDVLNGTVLAGYERIMDDNQQLLTGGKQLEIFNIFGHQPIGFGYSFSISKNNSKIISTDFSNSFSNSTFTDFNANTFILILEDNTFSLNGKIYFDLSKQKEATEITEPSDDNFYIIKGKESDVSEFKTLLEEKGKKFSIIFNSANKIGFDKQSTIRSTFSVSPEDALDVNFNYNGTGELGGFTVDIVSFIKKKFKKNLVLIVSKNLSNPLMGGKRKSKIHKKLKNKSTNKLSTKTKKHTNQSKKHKKNNLQQNKKKSKKF